MKQPWKLVALVSAVWLSIWAFTVAIRGSGQQAQPTGSQEAVKFVARDSSPGTSESDASQSDSPGECSFDQFTYPSWPDGFNVSVNALFVIGEQKSGSTWLWELLNGHPCLLTAAQPHYRMGAITTKETYYFTSAKIGSDAREFLIPWMGYDRAKASSDDVENSIGNDWFATALKVANVGTATTSAEYHRKRTYSNPNAKLVMQPCEQYYLLEATPHNINSPVAAKRMRALFPDSKAVAVLKEPALRMHSAYNQFSKPFQQSCNPSQPAPWCPIYRYYQLQLPTFAQAVGQELAYLRTVRCSFESADQERSWMSCFGCQTMDPWKHKRDNIHIRYPPYAPSAALSMYEPMLRAWTEFFPMEDVRVVNYHDLVKDQLEIVNQVLRHAGLEEYTQEHMAILNPEALGFKGSYASAAEATTFEGKDELREFFKPHNERLAEFLKDHPIPWHPFPVDV
eukprot:jgi/Ulvmu1/8048/UM004_0285.1